MDGVWNTRRSSIEVVISLTGRNQPFFPKPSSRRSIRFIKRKTEKFAQGASVKPAVPKLWFRGPPWWLSQEEEAVGAQWPRSVWELLGYKLKHYLPKQRKLYQTWSGKPIFLVSWHNSRRGSSGVLMCMKWNWGHRFIGARSPGSCVRW